MKALVIKQPGEAVVESVAEPVVKGQDLLLKVRMIGLCGSDLNSFRGQNPPLCVLRRGLGHST